VIEDAPWVVTPDFLLKHQIDYVVHDPAPYPMDGNMSFLSLSLSLSLSLIGLFSLSLSSAYSRLDIKDVYQPVKTMKRFLASKRTDGISTTDIIAKILKHREDYESKKSVAAILKSSTN
jgi:choline-phosphate cytidylyltransferase